MMPFAAGLGIVLDAAAPGEVGAGWPGPLSDALPGASCTVAC